MDLESGQCGVFLKKRFLGCGGWGEVKAQSSQPDMFPKVFPIALHFYPICFGKCCPPFTCIAGPKLRNSILQNLTFCIGEPV